MKAWAGRFLATSGAPDLLINNAALINRHAPTWEVPAEEFDRLIDVNIKGVANVLRHVVPAMIARESGVIVNLSSYWGRSVGPEVAPYCASKWAIEGLTRALAQELPKGLAAVPLNPGIIDTAMLRSTFGETAGHYLSPSAWAESAVPFLLGLGGRTTASRSPCRGSESTPGNGISRVRISGDRTRLRAQGRGRRGGGAADPHPRDGT